MGVWLGSPGWEAGANAGISGPRRGSEPGRKGRHTRPRSEPAGEGGRRTNEIEERRLAVLADYEILDTPAEQGFDELVQLASDLCEAPVALVGIVGRDRVWIKAGIGLAAAGATFPELGLFADVVDRGELLEIVDVLATTPGSHPPATRRSRACASSPARRSSPTRVWSSATLCVLDRVPRAHCRISSAADLRALAHQVVAQLALRRAIVRAQRAEQALRKSEEQFRAIADTTRRVDPRLLHGRHHHVLEPGGRASPRYQERRGRRTQRRRSRARRRPSTRWTRTPGRLRARPQRTRPARDPLPRPLRGLPLARGQRAPDLHGRPASSPAPGARCATSPSGSRCSSSSSTSPASTT